MYTATPKKLVANGCAAEDRAEDRAVSWRRSQGNAVYTNSAREAEPNHPFGVPLRRGETLAVASPRAVFDCQEPEGAAMFEPSARAVRSKPVLTARQVQVLILIANGNTTKEIAEALGVSFKTAAAHRSNIMHKLNVHDTAHLVRYAIREGLVEP